MSPSYLPPEAFETIEGTEFLSLYQFGEKSTNHHFCSRCGICPFNIVTSIPDDYVGTARPGYYRVNLACVDELDVYSLQISFIDGKSF